MQTSGPYISNKLLTSSLICMWRVIHRIPWLPRDFPPETGRARGLSLYVSNNRKTEAMVASVSSVNTLFVGGFFFSPSLLGRQRCSWWILKQISLIIVFHNCHAERDCPPRSYLCHCSPPHCRLFNKTQLTTEIVKSTSKIIKSKWRIYRWHFITINLRRLINKTPAPPPRLHPPHHWSCPVWVGWRRRGTVRMVVRDDTGVILFD